MTKSSRALVLLVWVELALSPLSPARAAGSQGASLCGLGLADISVRDQCFPPSRIEQVEGMMPVRPVRPVALVERLAHLPLTQLEVRNPGHPIEVRYLFGRIPFGAHRVADPSSQASRYAIVGELVGRSSLRKSWLFRHKDPEGGTLYVDWMADFRCHDLSVDVTSNLRGRLVGAVGKGILNEEVCGK
ncbi:MAG: hypothetical protein JOZ41_21895 [Chloroflexi bacterium]|nr:hypothetical protein [Chloroflexota bacterium]